ncbi:hypothetical protein N7E81_03735 [Reichenbachiella carrageenanivorans]|uniref:TerB-C domain-containing protein n=1 Tax=Reichenbachiella carrageenanivorans TaxID=2979869 RepID=A0ABY6D368_9BACT|nr:hypothetical protein [Reichenbachiella carrageenanivorans]UXX80209.1 hypothetical protein N7E81_03735 [Reichenbachiella carrageenanivorans]
MHGSKLNQEATITYSQSYSAKIISAFFSQNDGITGQQIISLSPVKQVNFFVLKELFDEWQGEIQKFKSPYFDYENDDVNQALKTLINTLSKNILITKEDFQPLLEKAVTNTLQLLYDPAGYYTQVLMDSDALDKAQELKSNSKYIKLHKALFDDLLIKLGKNTGTKQTIEAAASDYTGYETELAENVALFERTLALEILEKQVAVDELPMPEPLDELEEVLSMDEPKVATPPADTSSSKEINDEFEPIADLQEEEVDEEEDGLSTNVNEQYKEDIRTLNQRYEEKEKEKTVAAVLETQSLSNLKNNININQRYMFVNDLFDGDDQDYEIAMDEVEHCDSFDSSVELLVQNYAKKHDWDMNSDEVKELLKVIFKRFR